MCGIHSNNYFIYRSRLPKQTYLSQLSLSARNRSSFAPAPTVGHRSRICGLATCIRLRDAGDELHLLATAALQSRRH
jgi:hypothetical protein